MATEGEKRRRWQFSLRGLLAATLVVGVGLGLFVRWWFAPFAERHYYPNGRAMAEFWRQRDWRGRLNSIGSTEYYSTGAKASERDAAGDSESWSPDGRPISWEEFTRYWHTNNGDGTFRELDGQP